MKQITDERKGLPSASGIERLYLCPGSFSMEQGLPDVFAEPGVADFIRTACLTSLPGGGRAIDIHALTSDTEIIALFAGVADEHRFSMMFNTYTMSENSRFSPGLILMRNIIDHCVPAAAARSISGSAPTITSGCSARATSRSSTASFP